MKKYEITVYIPTHNRVSLLKRAVESVQNQTFTNFQLIIVNDGPKGHILGGGGHVFNQGKIT